MVENVIGTANFFSFQEDKTLCCHKVTNTRIKPNERSEKLGKAGRYGALFAECRNFFKIPSQTKGVAIAFRRREYPDEWKFGYIYQMMEDTELMEILVWNGPMSAIQEIDRKVLYPSFYVMNGEFLLSSSHNPVGNFKHIWQFHFTLLMCTMSKMEEFYYLNQVDGKRPEISFDKKLCFLF